MILDGVMVILASICLTIWHPGYGFGKRWNEAGFPFFTPKVKADQEAPQMSSPDGNKKVEPDMSSERL